jgi:hypothetical protein
MASYTGHKFLDLSPNGPGPIAGAEKTSQTVSFEASERPKWADFSPYTDRCHHFSHLTRRADRAAQNHESKLFHHKPGPRVSSFFGIFPRDKGGYGG